MTLHQKSGSVLSAKYSLPRSLRQSSDSDSMKALSIRQPWAWLIVNGYKDIENRTWSTGFRGRVYVHAGKRVKPGDFQEQRDYIRESGLILPEEPPLGAIVGEVTITDCVDSSSSQWFCGPHGFLLSSPVAYKDPIPYRGQLGFFEAVEFEVRNS